MKRKILNVACWDDTYGTHFLDLYPPKNRPEVKKWDINKENKLPYKNGFFDEVFCRGFLEHSVNVGMLISECKRVLKKGGLLRIDTDNANYWVFALKNSLHRWADLRIEGFGEDKHFSLFTDRHLKNLFDYYGLKITKQEYTFVKEINHQSKIRQTIKRIGNKMLLLTPFNRMAYMRLIIEGTK